MEFKVRELTDVKEKSVQEVEQDLLDKHEAQQELKFDDTSVKVSEETPKVEQTEVKEQDTVSEEKPEPTEKEITSPELSEEDVLSFIGERYV